MPWAVHTHKVRAVSWLLLQSCINLSQERLQKTKRENRHFSHTWDWICPSSPFGILMHLDSEWFCLVGASTGGNSSFPCMCGFTGNLSCYSIRKPQVAQKEKLEAKPHKSGSNVQWKKRSQKVLKCPARSVSSQWWMGASVLPCTDGRAKGQGTKGYFLIQDLWGN